MAFKRKFGSVQYNPIESIVPEKKVIPTLTTEKLRPCDLNSVSFFLFTRLFYALVKG